MRKSIRMILYILSVFPLFGFIIGIANYKRDVKFARTCLGIAIIVVIAYQILKIFK